MNEYLDLDCVNCGRHRVEEDYICEKCGYDNKNMKWADAGKTKQEVIAVDKLSQPIFECLEHGAGTCRNEYLIEKLQESCEGFRNKNKTLADELYNLRTSKNSDESLVAELIAIGNKLALHVLGNDFEGQEIVKQWNRVKVSL